ncbi:MAG: 16S rRNA (cytosine(967)-C(5))-methyltransferase RsmB [Lachnospiraceae bacterium]|nr:16S rRNA (cytosine(967)-C(5))-methyltransferase RsmB [Lachnospiraceae bacterium]
MTDKINSRELILEILLAVTRDGEYSHLALRLVLDKYQYLDKRDRSFITRVAEGTIENMIEADYIINQFSKTKTKKMKPVILNILRMSVYQIKYMDSVPDSAVCNEAVKLAGKRGFKNLKGFVNGVLRNISRNISEIEYPSEKDFVKYYSVKYSIPEWILTKWKEDFGEDKAKELAEASHLPAPTLIRVNKNKVSPAELKERLEERGIKVSRTNIEEIVPEAKIDYVFAIEGYDYISAIPEFAEGLFVVQDISSVLVAALADPKEGDYCIDVCAAPGGKSIHMAELLNGTGHVEARDKSGYKVSLIEETIERQQAKNVSAKVYDATIKDESSVEKADIVIADLPCSGLGVIRRKTDIKYHMTPEMTKELAKLQQSMLDTVCDYVKCGGTLMFSTCTINKEENEENLKRFLKKHDEFSLVFERQLFFDNEVSDGFYIAKMVKKNG